MMNIEINEKMVNDFYNCFDTGYEFEEFLKRFLEDLGFTDITVTKRSGDNGIDLICYKSAILDLDVNAEKYIVQAKRYKGTVPAKEIREFKGTLAYERRIFITTSRFSKSDFEEAENDQYRKIILISGKDILKYYLEHPEKDLIFAWNPMVSREKVRSIIIPKENKKVTTKQDVVLRLVSRNDIRTRILPIPYEIFEKIADRKKYTVIIDNNELELNINAERRYFGGVTEIYRKKGYIDYEGESKKKTYWKIDEKNEKIYIEFE